MAGKTRLLVTHSLPYLRFCDQVVVLREGRVVAAGPYPELVRSSAEFAALVGEFLKKEIAAAGGGQQREQSEGGDGEDGGLNYKKQ